MTDVICQFCNSKLSSKYVLTNHYKSNKKCLALRQLEFKTNFICKGCKHSCVDNQKLLNHHEVCKVYQNFLLKNEYDLKLTDKDKIINELRENHKKEIIDLQTNHSKEIKTLKEFNDKTVKDLQNQLDKMFSTIEKLASQAIDKPNTSNTTSVTTNNVRNNIFSDKYFLENIKPEDVKHKFHNYLTEQVFFSGQKGIAQLCTDHIIKTKDKKVLLTCSDVSRKKFKYVDELGNVKEDYEARTFTEKVFEPIKEVSQQIYQNIISDVQDEQEQLENIEDIQQIDYGRKSVLHDKTMKAIDCFAQIVNIDNPNHNSDFKNELAILNR